MLDEPVKVVARYLDGRVVKGYTWNFFPDRPRFHISPVADKNSPYLEEVALKDLKAVFFVKDFKGDPNYDERRYFQDGEKLQGRKVKVHFLDGEMLVVTTLGYDPNRLGFFLLPVDPKSNNIRVFVVSSAIKSLNWSVATA
ncbi:MAG: hypothetical protein K6U03_07055 [Firmicutes bacterium]|nr:hypothetical protein [Bacillota bacterium]